MPALSPAEPSLSRSTARPALMKRHSSQSSHGARPPPSPGSHTDLQQPLRHQVRGKHHARLVLPRGHSSRQNLAKMGRPGQGDPRAERHGRQRSHEGDTEIRLPGSLDETNRMEAARPQIKRNMTAYQLPRNSSHTKLKKNLSHGQLQRLNSTGRNLMAVGSQRAPPSPGLRAKSKARPKSAEFSNERDVREQQAELAGKRRKVGFNVGSAGDGESSDDEGMEEEEWTEESASASPYSTRQNTANNSRRTSVVQSRQGDRASLANVLVADELQQAPAVEDREQQARPHVDFRGIESAAGRLKQKEVKQRDRGKAKEDYDDDDDDDDDGDGDGREDSHPPSPRSQPRSSKQRPASPPAEPPHQLHHAKRSPLPAAKDHPNPTTSFLRRHSEHQPAQPLLSNINALDSTHSNTHSTAKSNANSKTNSIANSNRPSPPDPSSINQSQPDEELVSRFIASTSHPAPSSNPTTNPNTPKQSAFHTTRHQPGTSLAQQGPVSPGSTISAGSSGAATPALGRSRIELKMLQEKAQADLEDVTGRQPFIPAHVYDRRNESLKSYLNLAQLGGAATNDGRGGSSGSGASGFAGGPAPPHGIPGISPNQLSGSGAASGAGVAAAAGTLLGPEVFQGRFRAVQTELRVVQKFRDPLGESLARLRSCGAIWGGAAGSMKKRIGPSTGLRGSKSAISLPQRASEQKSAGARPSSPSAASATAKSGAAASPPKSSGASAKAALQNGGSKSSVQIKRAPARGVSFAGGPPVMREPPERAVEGSGSGEDGAEEIARRLWESVGA